MANLKQIVALCLDGKSYTQISNAVGCSRRDVAFAKKIIRDHDLTYEAFSHLAPDWFDVTFPDGRAARKQDFAQPDYLSLAQRLKDNKHLTRQILWEEYLDAASDPGLAKYRYTQFCEGLRAYITSTGWTDIIDHEPGQEVFVDWAGDKIPVIDASSGEVGFKASLFVAVLPYSGYMFATAAANEKMPAWIDCHVKAFEYFGKLPGILVPDNASTATRKPTKHSLSYRPVTQRYADLARYYDVLIVPTRPSRPKDKASVERYVQTAYTRIMGYFEKEVFYTLDELNEAIAERLDDINNVLLRPDGRSRRELFDQDEAPLMRDLPETPFTDVQWRKAKVDRNWHITCDYQYYSVPYTYIGKTLDVRLTRTLVSIFTGDRLVAEHSRQHGFRYRYSTDPQHSPRADDPHSKALTREELLRWASSYGPATYQVIHDVLTRNTNAQARGLLTARNILDSLGKRHDKTTLEPACQHVLDKKLHPSMKVIKRIQGDIYHYRYETTAPTSDTAQAHTTVSKTNRQIRDTDIGQSVFIRPTNHYE